MFIYGVFFWSRMVWTHPPASILSSSYSHWTIGSFEWEPSKLWNLIAWTGFFLPTERRSKKIIKTYNSIIFHIPRYSIVIPSEPWSVSTCFHTFQGHPRPSLYTPGPSGLEVSLPPVVFGCSPHPALAWRPTSSSARTSVAKGGWLHGDFWFLFFIVGFLWVLSARTKVEWNLERFFPPGTVAIKIHQVPLPSSHRKARNLEWKKHNLSYPGRAFPFGGSLTHFLELSISALVLILHARGSTCLQI